MNIEIPYRPDGGPAFPTDDTAYPGISRRVYFAAHAMNGVLSDPNANLTPSELAVYCYKCADAMLAQSLIKP